jgi:hypothetical protein
MQPRPASEHIRIARANVGLATQVCGAAYKTAVERAFNLLETAAAEMREAEAEVRSGLPIDSAELRRETALLKREIAVMMRVIDGCAALCRGLSMRLGCTALAYTPQGRPVAARPSSAACELQG